MLLLDNLINNYLNILSCLVILTIFNIDKYKFIVFVMIDILLNRVPIVSILILFLYFLNRLVFKKFVKNNINKFIFSIIYMFIFINLLYLINDYNFTYSYYLKSNIFSFVFNIFVYYIFIFYTNFSFISYN